MNPLFDMIEANFPNVITYKTYERQEVIFLEQASCKAVGFIIKGKMHIQTFGCGEDPYIIQTLNTGDTFGETLLFSNEATYLGVGIALDKIKIAYVGRGDLLRIMQESSLFLRNYLLVMAEKSILHQMRLKVLLQKTIRDKILFSLHEQAKTQGSLTVRTPTKEAWAAYLNIPRPSLSRELIVMRDEGLLKLDRFYVTLLKEVSNI
ncbi:MAG: Crp/Fnr family transcriptional regulator [Bacilli bacterium]|nr:Crp/Fnr family transcriptional regulator [Bacilli bacterium]